jgi:hypothetical protein
MVLRAIKDYLASRKRATLADLATRFSVEESALRSMLVLWERKGLVRMIAAETRACGECCACPPATEVCEWLGGDQDRAPAPPPGVLPAQAHRC